MKRKQTQNIKNLVFNDLKIKSIQRYNLSFETRNHVFISFVIILFKIIRRDRKVPLVEESPEYKNYLK